MKGSQLLIIFIVALIVSIGALFGLSKVSKKTEVVIEQTQVPSSVRVYLVKIDDQGQSGTEIGCGDSLVPITKEITSGNDPLKQTLQQLLSLPATEATSQDLYSAFSKSNLSVSDVKITGEKAHVYLTGNLSLGGVCDNPRVENQLSATALQFPNIRQVEFFVNGTPLSEILSEK